MLCASDLRQAKLNSANLSGTNFNSAKVQQVEVTGAVFSLNGVPAQAISQAQIDSMAIKPGREPPDLSGVTDQTTGEPLVWSEAASQNTLPEVDKSGTVLWRRTAVDIIYDWN